MTPYLCRQFTNCQREIHWTFSALSPYNSEFDILQAYNEMQLYYKKNDYRQHSYIAVNKSTYHIAQAVCDECILTTVPAWISLYQRGPCLLARVCCYY